MAGSAVLRKITTRAKHIRRLHGGTWKAAIKKAGAEYRGGRKMSGTRKQKSRPKKAKIIRMRKVRRIKSLHAAEGRAIRSLGSVASHTAAAKKLLEHQIGKAESQKYTARKKSTKRKIQKRISAMKAKYRKLC
jgi:hypothetical protein